MKRKNTNTNVSDEEASEDEQQLTDNDVESDEESDDDIEALDASATESDEDKSDVDNSDFGDNQEDDIKPEKSKSEKVKEDILQRYQERQGKQLYIRFPHKIPETQEALEGKVKELSPLVVKVHKPRQKHVRFCLVDFATKEDRDNALKQLKKSIKKGELEKYVVNIPRTECSEFVSELVERKLKSIENKKAKQRLKKESKKSIKENNFTSTVIVLNLPKTTSLLQVRELFPNAVDINIKPGKGKLNKDKSIAAITLPSTKEARNVVKKKFSLGGNQLVIKFDNQKLKKKFNLKKNKPSGDSVNSNENIVNDVSEPTIKKPKLESINAPKSDESNKIKKINKNTAKNKKVITK